MFLIYDEITDEFLSNKSEEIWAEFWRKECLNELKDGTQIWSCFGNVEEDAKFKTKEEALDFANYLKNSFIAQAENVNFTIFDAEIEKEQTIRAGKVVAERAIVIMKCVASVEEEPFENDDCPNKLEEELASLIESCYSPHDTNNAAYVAARKILSGLKDLGYKIVS